MDARMPLSSAVKAFLGFGLVCHADRHGTKQNRRAKGRGKKNRKKSRRPDSIDCLSLTGSPLAVEADGKCATSR